ncbi:MAG: molybdopterin molybdotransferase MoeA [Aureispira sp.]|nr:molybdopterin molybdotransferase MoeA [Aureispira sp.]
MIDVEAAKSIVRQLSCVPKIISLPLTVSLGYVLSADVLAPIYMPPFDQSAMDGYALTLGKTLEYKIIGEVQAGSPENPSMEMGDAVRIFTGAAVPSDANAVIMQEKTTVEGDLLRIDELPKPSANIRPLGEQIKKGEIALEKGTELSPAAVGFLAGIGVSEVTVFQKPSIAVVVTGDELVSAGQVLERGQIYESNGVMLANALQQTGFEAPTVVRVKDDYEATKKLLKELLEKQDFVLISGGISVGDYDFVGKALLELGVEQLFYKVRQKPGKPMFLGKTATSVVFALPGNPAAALSCYYQYVLTALKKAVGLPNYALKKVYLPITKAYLKKGNRAHFLKAKLTENGVETLDGQSSAMLFSFAYADALIYIPQDQMQTEAGALVEVHLLP